VKLQLLAATNDPAMDLEQDGEIAVVPTYSIATEWLDKRESGTGKEVHIADRESGPARVVYIEIQRITCRGGCIEPVNDTGPVDIEHHQAAVRIASDEGPGTFKTIIIAPKTVISRQFFLCGMRTVGRQKGNVKQGTQLMMKRNFCVIGLSKNSNRQQAGKK